MTDIPDQEEEIQTPFFLRCVGGTIYLEGGGDNVRSYNPFINEWGNWYKLSKPKDDPCKQQRDTAIVSKITNYQLSKRSWPGAAALNGKVYVAGGGHRDGSGQILKSVECYDHDTETWSEVANMNFARTSFSLLSLRGRLYAMGGDGVGSVEVYDPDNNSWTVLEGRMEGMNGACTIKKYFVH